MMCPEGVRATRNTYLLTPDQYFLVCRTCEACQRRTDRLYPNGLTQARSKIFKGKPTSGQTFEGVLALVVTWNTGSYIARLLAVKTKARATALEESNQVRNHALESVRRATADAAAAAAAALAYAPAASAVLSTGSVGGAGGGVDIVSGGGSKGSKGLSGLAAAPQGARQGWNRRYRGENVRSHVIVCRRRRRRRRRRHAGCARPCVGTKAGSRAAVNLVHDV